MQNLQIKHLYPNSMYFDKDNYKLCKVIAGDMRIFHQMDTSKTLEGEYGTLLYTREQLKFLTPETICSTQPIWDLGVILYEICSGNHRPFEHSNQKVLIKLIQKYNVVFPINLPYGVSDDL
jgi:hypothetical protein